MLSVLIPIYNYDCRRLINSLSAQAENLDVDYEILAFDDGSSLFLEENREVKNLPHVVYRELGKNIGRSAIRNLLADEAHYPYLVFMDCDMQVVSDSYLKNYLDQIGNAQVMCGGHIYCRKEDLSRDRFLHWAYGMKRESKIKGNKRAFLSGNFFIEKNIFEKVRFDGKIWNYGHEDTLFGIELMKNNIAVLYVDNPLLHQGLNTNKEFLEKIKNSLKNLFLIYMNLLSEKDAQNIRLIATYEKLKKMRMTGVIRVLGSALKPIIERNLNSRYPSMFLFDFYKLAYFCSVLHSERKV